MMENHWRNLFSLITGPFILLGDFNGHHPLWGHAKVNNNGRELERYIVNNNLVVLNDGNPTHITYTKSSILDLIVASPNIALSCQSTTFLDTFGSDHAPILTIVNLGLRRRSWNSSSGLRLKSEKINWERYKYLLENSSPNEPDYDDFQRRILSAAKECHRSASLSSRPPCPWWDNECGRAVAKRKRLIAIFHKTGRYEHFTS